MSRSWSVSFLMAVAVAAPACGDINIVPNDDKDAPGVADATTGTGASCATTADCDDGDPCTGQEACVGGKCTAGTPVSCGHLTIGCVAGKCDTSTGECVSQALEDGDGCDDQNGCTVDDTCAGGQCQGSAKICQALDTCHDSGTCDPGTGECSNPSKPAGTPCNDGDGCTDGDTCSGGSCKPGKAPDCSDGLECTSDACVATSSSTWDCPGELNPGMCLIAGQCLTEGSKQSGQECALCRSAESRVDWSLAEDGQPCTVSGASGVCGGGVCDPVPAAIPLGMVWVPAGSFMMGCTKGDKSCDSDAQPEHEVSLEGFAIGQREVTVGAYAKCVEAMKCTDPGGGGSALATYPKYTEHPVNYVSWQQASDFCAEVGRRLCTEAEWEKAARGTDGRIFPWGAEEPGCGLAHFSYPSTSDWGCGTQLPAQTGSYPEGKSPYGAEDLLGNVSEWVADYYGADYYASASPKNPTGPTTGSSRVKRGGGWKSVSVDLYAFERESGLSAQDSAGIRCCWDPGLE